MLVIETKLESALAGDQLRRHYTTLMARGFKDLLGITISLYRQSLADTTWTSITWRDLYAWLEPLAGSSSWGKELRNYMEIVEARMIGDEKLGSGTLTRFTGVHFGKDHQFSYFEGKRILKLLRQRLSEDRPALFRLGVDLTIAGRSIMNEPVLWDRFSLLRFAQDNEDGPHLTFAIGPAFAEALVTVPNSWIKNLRRQLRECGQARILAATTSFTDALPVAWLGYRGLRPTLRLFQRRYRFLRDTEPVYDGDLRLDVRTAIPPPTGVLTGVPWPKQQFQWTDMPYEMLTN